MIFRDWILISEKAHCVSIRKSKWPTVFIPIIVRKGEIKPDFTVRVRDV
jgi:hypothetical protein